MITHVVVFWLNGGGEELAGEFRAAAARLSEIPEALNFRFGSALESPRGAVDDSFDLAISMDFEDADALERYQCHPEHQAFVNEWVKPKVGRFVVYDFSS